MSAVPEHPWWLDPTPVAAHAGAGLSRAEANIRLTRFGPNLLRASS